MQEQIIDGLYDASSALNLIANAADNIAAGTATDPAKLASHIRQTAWAISEMLGRHVDLLEIAQRSRERSQ